MVKLQGTGLAAHICSFDQGCSTVFCSCLLCTFSVALKKLLVPHCPYLQSRERNIAYLTEAMCNNYCRALYNLTFNIYKLVLEPTFYIKRKKYCN